MIDERELERWLAASLSRQGVPGGAAGVLVRERIVSAAAGKARLDTGQPFTPDTLFQFGSITKLYTATLVMQAVERERLDLNDRVMEILPALRPADDRFREVRLRHLLTHTSGLPPQHYVDTGRGDDCLARYVDVLNDVRLDHEPGAKRAYANANFVLAGRILEVIHGQVWDKVLLERLLVPAGLTETFTDPQPIVIRRFALGYYPGEDGRPAAPAWGGMRCYAPGGSTPASTISDLLRFASIHLNQGVAVTGARVLEARTVEQMQAELYPAFEPDAPAGLGPVAGGIGWAHYDVCGARWIGHDGSTAGQVTILRTLPAARCAFVVFANAANGYGVLEDLIEPIASSLSNA